MVVFMFTFAPETVALAFNGTMTALSDVTTSAAVTISVAPTIVMFCGAEPFTATLNTLPLIAHGPALLLVTEARSLEFTLRAALVSTGTALARGPYTNKLAVE